MKKRNFITLGLGALIIALGFLYPRLYAIIQPPSTDPDWPIVAWISMLIIFYLGSLTIFFAIIGFIFPKVIEENCPVSTTLTSIIFTFLVAIGTNALTSFDPVNVPLFAVIATICYILALTLVFLYVRLRKKYPSRGGICMDIVIVVLTFIPLSSIAFDIIAIVQHFTTL